MNPLSERALAERLRQAAESFSLSADFESALVDSAFASGRQRDRRRSIILLAVAACVAASVVVGVTVFSGRVQSAPPADQDTPRPSASPSASPTPSGTKEAEPKGPPVFQWAEELPRGDDARAVFDANGMLYAGDQQFPMPGVPRWQNAVYASTPNGWLISWSACSTGSRNCSYQGVMASDGTTTTLPYPATGARETFALSPDNSQVMFDRWILDARTGEVVADLPKNVGYVNAWTPEGIVYFDDGAGHRQWWWRPGSQPVQVQEPANYRSDGLGIESTRDCSTIQRLLEEGAAQVVMRYCGESPVADLSPSGTTHLPQ